MKLKVAPEKKEAFEKEAYKWHLLVKCLGWGTLAEMRANNTAPFDQETKLVGNFRQRKKQAHKILVAQMAADLRAAGLEVSA